MLRHVSAATRPLYTVLPPDTPQRVFRRASAFSSASNMPRLGKKIMTTSLRKVP